MAVMRRTSDRDIPSTGSETPLAARSVDPLGIVACVVVAGFAAGLSWFKLSSLDIGYHVAYGRHFLEHGRIVGFQPDPFLYPETALRFVNANWGSQVLMAFFDRIAGAPGLIALRCALIAVIFALIAVVVRKQVRGWLAVAAAWLLAAVGGYERFTMRPELLSYALMLGVLVILVGGVRTRRHVAILGVLQLAWVNLHSYFLVGVFLTGAWWTAGVLRRFSKGSGTTENSEHHGRLRFLSIALAIQTCMCFINPWHLRGALFPIATLKFLHSHEVMGGGASGASTSSWSEISEFQSPFSFHGERICGRTIRAYYALAACCAVGAVGWWSRGQTGPVLALVLLFVMTTQMRRNIAQFALAGAPLAAIGLASLPSWSKLSETVRRRLRFTAVLLLVTPTGWWTLHLADGWFYYDERRISREPGSGYSEQTFPIRAARWLAEQDALRPNLFVDYFSSSNTLPWLPERFRLLVDTNTFAYEDATLDAAAQVVQGQAPHNPFFERYGVNVVMLRCNSNAQMLIRRMVRDDGEWALVYFDPTAVIFVRRMMAHVAVIQEHQVSESDLDASQWIVEVEGVRFARALTLYTRANVPLLLGWHGSAAELLEAAIDLAPDHHESWINLGICHARMATEHLRARRLETEHVRARRLEAGVRELGIARGHFQRALALDPQNRIARANLERVNRSFGGRGQ